MFLRLVSRRSEMIEQAKRSAHRLLGLYILSKIDLERLSWPVSPIWCCATVSPHRHRSAPPPSCHSPCVVAEQKSSASNEQADHDGRSRRASNIVGFVPGHGYCHGGREESVRLTQVDVRGCRRGCEGKLSALMITRFWSMGTGIPIGRSNSSHQRATFPGSMQLCPESRPEQGRSLTWVPVKEVSRGWE
jgi:hypothetical protein